MSNDDDDRLQSEISLLEAMYPDQVAFNTHTRDLRYTADGGSVQIQLPSGYLIDELPVIISARLGRTDGREALSTKLASCNAGEEVLDFIISAFNDLLEQHQFEQQSEDSGSTEAVTSSTSPIEKATVVVWLHHLLNMNKRKQALSPPSSGVSGVTKPGYPGVLIYSGPAQAVNEHVNELRQLNWQAFSVRLESEEEWAFQHGTGVKEFETMKEIVADVGEDKKYMFMEAMRMK